MEELNARISFEWNGKRYVLVSIYSRFYNKPSKGENFDLDLYQLTYDAFVLYKLNDKGTNKWYNINNVVLEYVNIKDNIVEADIVKTAPHLSLYI